MRLSHEMCGGSAFQNYKGKWDGNEGVEANTVGDEVRKVRKFILYSALSTKPRTLTFTKRTMRRF